ncbi:NAD(P)-binding protein, partial [Acinetobacter baumannii]
LKGGANVTIFEKSKVPGGRATTLVKDGAKLNLGPHALYKGGAAYKFLCENGLEPAGNPPAFKNYFAAMQGTVLRFSPLSLLITNKL